MSYVDNVIGLGEDVEYEAQVSLWNFATTYLVCAIAGFWIYAAGVYHPKSYIPLLILICSFLYIVMIMNSIELAITNRRIIAKIGIIRRETIEINLEKIESIRVSQSILGRILDYGTVSVVGTGSSVLAISGISSPIMFRRIYDEILVEQNAANKPDNAESSLHADRR